MTDEGTHCPAVRHGDWPGGQVTGGREVAGGGVGRAVAKNNIKREISFAQITFDICKKERKRFVNIIHTFISTPTNVHT